MALSAFVYACTINSIALIFPELKILFHGQQIHALIMSLSYARIEIKTAQSLESWSGGVLVMVSGSVQVKDYSRRRKFMQTFFLAPQEKGFFVLNDIFHFVEEDPVHQQQAVLLPQSNLDPKLNASSAINKPGKYLHQLCSCT